MWSRKQSIFRNKMMLKTSSNLRRKLILSHKIKILKRLKLQRISIKRKMKSRKQTKMKIKN
jgi:hypothetical protein